MNTLLQNILPIFFLIGVGVITHFFVVHNFFVEHVSWLEKWKEKIGIHKTDNWISMLNKLALYIALPALIFSSLTNTSTEQIGDGSIYILNIFIIVAVVLLTYTITHMLRIKKDIANAYIMCVFFGNVAYIGFPFIGSIIHNSQGPVSVLVAIHVFLAFTLGLFILEKSRRKKVHLLPLFKNVLINPLVASVLVGLLFLFFSIPIPFAISQTLHMLGASASPIVLIAIGMFLVRKIAWDKNLFHSAIIATIKIVLFPILFFIFARWYGPTTLLSISILEAAMPVALTNFALTEIYPMDKSIVANAIIISTIVSFLTLSVFTAILV